MGERERGKSRFGVMMAALALNEGKTVCFVATTEESGASFALDVHQKCGKLPSVSVPAATPKGGA